jgi:hypothetical protein
MSGVRRHPEATPIAVTGPNRAEPNSVQACGFGGGAFALLRGRPRRRIDVVRAVQTRTYNETGGKLPRRRSSLQP